MYIKKLQLLNFRNYDELGIELTSGVNIFIGDNAQGKTNILESIYYCSLAKSHRTSRIGNLLTGTMRKHTLRPILLKID